MRRGGVAHVFFPNVAGPALRGSPARSGTLPLTAVAGTTSTPSCGRSFAPVSCPSFALPAAGSADLAPEPTDPPHISPTVSVFLLFCFFLCAVFSRNTFFPPCLFSIVFVRFVCECVSFCFHVLFFCCSLCVCSRYFFSSFWFSCCSVRFYFLFSYSVFFFVGISPYGLFLFNVFLFFAEQLSAGRGRGGARGGGV